MMTKVLIYAISGIVGGLGGFLFWRFVGCQSGTCPITSSPTMSTIFGLVFGLFLASSFIDKANASEVNTPKATETVVKQEDNNTGKTIHLTKSEFLTRVANYEINPNEWKYLGDKPAIVDFYTTWCGPCKAVAPLLEELAKEYAGQIYIYKVDVDQERELAAAFGIRSIPSILFIPMTKQPQMSAGALPKAELKKAIDNVLLK